MRTSGTKGETAEKDVTTTGILFLPLADERSRPKTGIFFIIITGMAISLPEIVTSDFINYLRSTYALDWYGTHGWDHWVRVYENGMHIALQNGADQTVVALFAFTHDMARTQEGGDKKHGPLAARRIPAELQGRFFTLTSTQLSLLVEAVRLHTAGQTEADKTVQTCWDADRLDLWRAHIRPDPKYLCTPEARDPRTIEWAVERSARWRQQRG